MPKLKIEDDELDVEALESAEYEESSRYHGEIPPKGTVLRGRISKMWWTYTQSDDPMLVVLFVAEDNEGKTAKYNGLPVWERLPLTAKAKFKWAPFFEVIGLTIRDVKTKTVVADEDDERFGAPITKIGMFEPGEDVSWVRLITGTHKYEGAPQVDADVWMEYEETEEEAEEEPEDTEEVEVEEEEAEEEPEAAPPARGRGGRTAAAKAPAKAAAKAPTRSPGRAATASRAAKAAPAKAAAAPARGRRGTTAKGSDEDPPF